MIPYKPNNPPAFPSKSNGSDQRLGMTLRDYFAAKAMQSYLTDTKLGWTDITAENCAERSYQVADAMLKQREK